MSIATEITRIQEQKELLRQGLVQKGCNIPSGSKLDAFVSALDDIGGGSGSSEAQEDDETVYDLQYMTIESEDDSNSFSWIMDSSGSTSRTISISLDNGGTWTQKTSSSPGTVIATINKGEKILIKGGNTSYHAGQLWYGNYFSSTGKFKVYGNIMSLIRGDEFYGRSEISSANQACFNCMFKNCTGLTSAKNLILPYLIDSGANYCFHCMFYGCTNLKDAPEILSTYIPSDGCNSMFFGCTSLENPPYMCIYSLGARAFSSMFNGCTSLKKAPLLPARTLQESCYSSMFNNCTNLEEISISADNISPVNCLAKFCSNVKNTGTFIIKGKADYSSVIPSGWNTENYWRKPFRITSLDASNKIILKKKGTSSTNTLGYSVDGGNTWNTVTGSAEGTEICTLNAGEYVSFRIAASDYFNNSTSNYLFINSTGRIEASGNIASFQSATFSGSSWTSNSANYCFARMFYGCSKLVSVKNLVLPYTSLSTGIYQYMFCGCSSLTDTPELPATTLGSSCYQEMFEYCISLERMCSLPATQLQYNCYRNMFTNSSIKKIGGIPKISSVGTQSFMNMFQSCFNLVKAPVIWCTANYTTDLISYIFRGCCKLKYINLYMKSSTFTEYALGTGVNGVMVYRLGYTPESGFNGLPYGWTGYSYNS